jgi:hypothetical protein
MGLMESAKNFLWKIALTKGVKRGIQVGMAYLMAKLATLPLDNYGVSVDPEKLQAELMVAISAVMAVLLNWLKQKKGFSWL